MRLILCELFLLGVVGVLANSALAFTREVYVWQRQSSPAVYQAVESVRNDIDGCAILAAEVNWQKSEPQLFRSALNYAALATCGRPVGLVLRVGPFAGRFISDDETAHYLTELVSSLLKTARAGGLEPAEMQVDFDCASSKLAGYRLWLEAIRHATGPTKLVFTALPDWLGRDDFRALAETADGYILQVHSLEKPTGPDSEFHLCDPERASAWIRTAARVGVPFRVALPTYGYRLAFDATGKFIGLSAEGPRAGWPAGTQIRMVRADVSVVGTLARHLTETKPVGCTGIIWFRLPVAGDRLNWSLTTLKVVLRGEAPVSRLVTEVLWSANGLAEISVVNRGEQDELLPPKIVARWTDTLRVLAGDSLSGYSLVCDRARAGVLELTATAPTAAERIAPGRRRKIGWVRFSHEISLTTQIIDGS